MLGKGVLHLLRKSFPEVSAAFNISEKEGYGPNGHLIMICAKGSSHLAATIIIIQQLDEGGTL